MKAMIFAAGLGTRLKPLTDTMPKALVPLAGKPLLSWQIEKLQQAGIKDIVVNVHHFPDQIIDYVKTHHTDCHITISDEREELLETGGGLRKAEHLLTDGSGEPILVCNVDILSNISIPNLIASYDPKTMGLLVVSERSTQRYLLFDQNLTLKGWENTATGETRPSEIKEEVGKLTPLAFSGMQIVSPEIFSHMDDVVKNKGNKFSLIDLYLSLCSTQTLKAYIPKDYKMMDVGKIDQIEEAEKFARNL